MLFRKKVYIYNLFLLCIFFLSGCTIVKQFNANKPFVFDNSVVLNGQLSKDERKTMLFEIGNYWDDSLKALKTQQFGIIYKLKKPPVFDSTKLSSSILSMNAYLNAKGFYYANFQPNYRFDTVKNQIRTYINMKIDIGKGITIDSASVALSDSNLQQLATSYFSNSFLKKGIPYSKQLISSELDRLTLLFKRNGYYKLQKEDFYALVDTLDKRMLSFNFNPFNQAKLIADITKNRNINPNWDVQIQQKPITDSSKLIQYKIGHIYYFPEYNGYDALTDVVKDSSLLVQKTGNSTIKHKENKFKITPLKEHTYIKRGELYNEEYLFRTINRLGRLGTWTAVDYLLKPTNSDTLDAYFFLTPAIKQGFTVGLEGSRNTGDIGSGNLLGLATNFTYTNRNVWKQAIQSVTNFRTGVEFNIDQQQSNNTNNFLQTIQTSASHTYSIPRLIIPSFFYFKDKSAIAKGLKSFENERTVISFSGAYTNRKEFYQLRNFIASFGYEFNQKANFWSFKPLNIELFGVDTLQGLVNLFEQNPFLRNSFRNGNVIGSSLNWSRTLGDVSGKGTSHFLRFGLEESGSFVKIISKSLNERVFNYVKLEAEYRFLNKYPKGDELATRAFVGWGIPGGNTTMPVFKQYFLGGPNSMRAWGLRQLGLGSSRLIDTTTSGYTDRFGDLAIETNIEYRFPLLTFSAVKITSAVYADIGNIWNSRKSDENPEGTLSIQRLTKDIAIGMGTGLRFDFNYFLFRLDFAYKIKDPARLENGGWIDFKNFEWVNTRSNGVQVKNFAFQFGIGLPF
ncbi:MAG: BamA/TamA family outer membrane protein [Chitinophagaceae bacterium]